MLGEKLEKTWKLGGEKGETQRIFWMGGICPCF
jgi:hypothetical protein